MDREFVTGLVLAGGRGVRMESVDKGLQPFRGRPLVAHALERLAPQVGALVISANRHLERYATFGHRVVTDSIAVEAGPLAGLHAGLVACRTAFLVVVPCDVPSAPRDLVERLATAFDDGDCDVATVRTSVRAHPVFCLVRATVADDLADFIAVGGRSVGAWAARSGARAVSFDDEDAFANLNTFPELLDAENAAERAAERAAEQRAEHKAEGEA